jgi:hypothetical protein
MLSKPFQETSWVLLVLCFGVASLSVGRTVADAATVGQQLSNVEVRDADDRPTWIPDFGKKLIGIFYNDADEADMNDPLADAITAKDFDESKYKGMGIGDLEDSKLPNFIIRRIAKAKVEKYNTVILTDPKLLLPKAWDLGDCNNTAVFILIGKDKRVKYVKKGPIRGAEIDAIVKLIEELIR